MINAFFEEEILSISFQQKKNHVLNGKTEHT